MPFSSLPLKRLFLGVILAIVLLLFFRDHLPDVTGLRRHHLKHADKDGFTSQRRMLSVVRDWQKRERIRKIVGLVFYEKRQEASILDCYLKRNLVKNGGILDEVIWLQQTKDAKDATFLDTLVRSEAQYSRPHEAESDIANNPYGGIEDDLLYIRIDSGIVYIEDGAILSMAHTRAKRPDFYFVSANVVNQPLSSWLHLSLGAVKPYLPDNDNRTRHESHVSWRASRLPSWSGASDFNIEQWSPPTSRQHRWLPVTGKKDHLLHNTPIVHTTYDAYKGQDKWKWMIAAQQHYSLLENLETGAMSRYKFHLWNYQALRMGVQFIAMTGKDFNAAKPIGPDDEEHLAVKMTKTLGRSAVADGRGVAAYYSSKAQLDGLSQTDILERYRSFAQEHVCKGRILWTPESDVA